MVVKTKQRKTKKITNKKVNYKKRKLSMKKIKGGGPLIPKFKPRHFRGSKYKKKEKYGYVTRSEAKADGYKTKIFSTTDERRIQKEQAKTKRTKAKFDKHQSKIDERNIKITNLTNQKTKLESEIKNNPNLSTKDKNHLIKLKEKAQNEIEKQSSKKEKAEKKSKGYQKKLNESKSKVKKATENIENKLIKSTEKLTKSNYFKLRGKSITGEGAIQIEGKAIALKALQKRRKDLRKEINATTKENRTPEQAQQLKELNTAITNSMEQFIKTRDTAITNSINQRKQKFKDSNRFFKRFSRRTKINSFNKLIKENKKKETKQNYQKNIQAGKQLVANITSSNVSKYKKQEQFKKNRGRHTLLNKINKIKKELKTKPNDQNKKILLEKLIAEKARLNKKINKDALAEFQTESIV